MNQSSQAIGFVTQLKLPNGALYEGEVFENRPHGRGKMKYSNSQKYEGDFFQGMKQGKGKYYYMKGQLYIGDWFQNKKHGKGQYFYKNGDIYTGDFMNNLKHGNGRIQETNGNYYEGSFYMNYKDKEGIYYDTVNKKKIEFSYDKGKIIKQQQILMVESSGKKQEEEEDQQQLEEEDEEDKDSSKRSEQDVKKGKVKKILSEEVFNSGDYSSETKRGYASYAAFHDEIKKVSSNKKIERASHFKPENFIDPSLLEKKICQWGLQEVSAWLNQIGFGDCIEDFRENNIQGDSLLVLYNEDLKELRVNALGDRRILMREIEFLRLIFKSQCLNDQILQYSQRELNIELVRDLEEAKQSKFDSKPLNNDNGSSSSSSLSSNGNQKSSKIERKESKDGKMREGKEDSRKHQQKKREKTSIQSKVSEYLNKKGIKLTFLIKKQQIEIIKPIGKGGYGQVFLGKLFGQEVAVKKYLKKRGFRNKHIGHFVEEVQVISKLTHPCIVLYMGMCIYDNQYALITEFLCGGSLFDCLHKKQERLSEELLVSFIKDVSLGMAYLHQKGVLHCDLKSSNLLIDQNQNIKLCDFGLSRIVSTKNKKKNKNIRVGTPHWMAPEILKGEKYECPSDVYSFGILMWEMMTGRIPYKDFSTAQIIGMVGNDEKHHIGVPDYPNKAIIDIFLRCTSRNPEQRPSFKVIVREIQAIEEELKDRLTAQQM